MLKADASGQLVAAIAGTDYLTNASLGAYVSYSAKGSIIPNYDISYDLGSSTARWSSIYSQQIQSKYLNIQPGGNFIAYNSTGGYFATLTFSSITGNWSYNAPDGSGTLALTQQATDYWVTNSSYGLVLTSPNGTRWRVQVNNSGALTTTSF